MSAFYSEFDPQKAAWLRELIKQGLITPGDVDERDLNDVTPDELARYTQVHLCAGIGVWSYALRRAGWPDDRPVWTASLPCQPFSAAGKGEGVNDERHLWPTAYRLIDACRPTVLFGEQVASALIVGSARGLKEAGLGIPETVSGQTSCEGPCATCKGQGCEAWSAFRLGGPSAGTPETDRCGELRSYRIAVESARGEDLGQPLFGQDDSICGVCVPERPCGLPWCEQCDGGLGGTDPGYDASGYSSTPEARIQRLLSAFGGEVEADSSAAWFDTVCADLERSGYAIGACDTPAAGVGAPHIRSRLYFVAHRGDGDVGYTTWPGSRTGLRDHESGEQRRLLTGDAGSVGALGHAHDTQRRTDCTRGDDSNRQDSRRQESTGDTEGSSDAGDMDHAKQTRLEGRARHGDGSGRWPGESRPVAEAGTSCKLADANGRHPSAARLQRSGQHGQRPQDGELLPAELTPGPTNGFWRDADWIHCRPEPDYPDGRWRAVESGTFPLVNGAPARLGRLRGYGDGIVATLAETFIREAAAVIGGEL